MIGGLLGVTEQTKAQKKQILKEKKDKINKENRIKEIMKSNEFEKKMNKITEQKEQLMTFAKHINVNIDNFDHHKLEFFMRVDNP